ncbi:MAG: hypothetical protein ACI4DY_06985 [Monoglobaceae bacterium]
MTKKDYQDNLVSRVIESIENHGGNNCLSSIVLTGSFGRGEPTFETDSDGNLHLKSDVEIALIFPRSNQKAAVYDIINSVSSEFDEDLNLMPINEKRIRKAYNFNFSMKSPKYKTIFTFDLFNGSKTVWGRDFIGEKDIRLADVDIYEAKRLIANRIGELIYLQNNCKDDEKEYLRIQWKGKLMLAIVSAWLICDGKYVSSYHVQYDIINQSKNAVSNQFGSQFLEEYDKVFSFLRENGEKYEISDALLIEYVKQMDMLFKERKISSPKVNSFSRIAKYYVKYIKSGIKYGICGFEDKILQSLITDYCNKSDKITQDANAWHNVLY